MPLFTIDTDADYIKIVRVAGEPEIVGCERGGFTLTSQSFRDVSFRVRNKGSSSGSFTGNLRCNDAAQALAPQTITTQPGQTVTYRARNGFASTTDQEIDCTFTVTDRVSGRQATCGYQWQVEARRCSDGVTSCSVENPNQLMICRNGFPELLETCERGCVGNACRDENDPLRETDCDDGYDNDGDGLVDQLDPDCEGASNIPENERLCQEAITVGGTLLVPDIGQDADGDPCTGTFATVRWALAVIVFIAAWFAITYGLNRLLRRGRRTQPGLVTLNVVIGLVVAALLYILVMKLFVIGIIVGVVASILATVLPRFRRF
jgi:hypothetical protein